MLNNGELSGDMNKQENNISLLERFDQEWFGHVERLDDEVMERGDPREKGNRNFSHRKIHVI